MTLTAYSAALPITAGGTYQFTGQVTGALTAPLGQGGRIVAAYANVDGQSAGEDLLWQNPTNFNGTLAVQQTVTANANAATLRLALTAVLDAGHLDFGDFNRQRLTAGAVIRRSTYMLAGQAVAVRLSGDPDGNDGLHYLYSDHLGSASAMQKDDGSAPIITRYTPFGGYRAGSGTNEVTDRGFTGHKHNDDLGLVYMNARFYVSGIGRFASADTLVPDPANPQSYNRYSYVLNRALNLTDPTGHRPSDGCGYEGCTLSSGFYSDSTWQLSDKTLVAWDPNFAAIEHNHPLDILWDNVMDTYYQPIGSWIDATGDIVGGGDGAVSSGIAELLYREGADISGAEFFDLFGKLFDVFGAGFDGLNYIARSEAIYAAWMDPEFGISGEQLYYLNTRAAAELRFSLGIAGGSMLLGGFPAVAAGATETSWNVYATAGEDRLGPDEWLAREYAGTMYTVNAPFFNSLARAATSLMIALKEN